MSEAFLQIKDLKKGFGEGETRQEVLKGIGFSASKGEFCVLLGPSGSGKSTLLNIIGGIDSCDLGRAIVKKPDILLCDEPTGALRLPDISFLLVLLLDYRRIRRIPMDEALKDME